MDIKTESRHAGDFLISEASGTRSREEVVVAAGAGALAAGTVLGQVLLGDATAAAAAANTGDGTIGTITVGAAKAGVYTLTVVEPANNAGAFVVEDPAGINVGSGTVGVEFVGGGLTFTLADGDADFIAGDQFTITVAAGSGEYVAYDDEATDGSAQAAGVLYTGVNATSAAANAVIIARDAEVLGAYLTGLDDAARTQLAALGIIVR